MKKYLSIAFLSIFLSNFVSHIFTFTQEEKNYGKVEELEEEILFS